MLKFLSLSFYRLHCKMPFYAVSRGRRPGVFNSWAECEQQVKGFSGAKYKKFSTKEDALSFVHAGAPPQEVKKPGIPVQQAKKKSGEFKKTILLDTLPESKTLGIGNHAYQQPVPFGKNDTKKAKKTELTKKLDTISLEMQRLHSLALGIQQQLEEEDTTDQTPLHTSQGKRQRVPDMKKANKRRKTMEDEESDLFSGSDADLAAAVEDPVIVYTDGCCHSNGRKKATAGIGVYWGPDNPNNVAARLQGRQTNNRAEIHAVCRALRQAKQMGKTSVIVNTDSQFLINSITKWIHKWKRNGWKLTDGTNVKNREDFEELDQLQKGMTVKYVHVRGHSGIHGNEMADQLANEGARKPYHKKHKFDFEESDSDSDF